MKFSVKNFFGKCDQIRRKLHIWSHLLKKPLMENLIFSVVSILVTSFFIGIVNVMYILEFFFLFIYFLFQTINCFSNSAAYSF